MLHAAFLLSLLVGLWLLTLREAYNHNSLCRQHGISVLPLLGTVTDASSTEPTGVTPLPSRDGVAPAVKGRISRCPRRLVPSWLSFVVRCVLRYYEVRSVVW